MLLRIISQIWYQCQKYHTIWSDVFLLSDIHENPGDVAIQDTRPKRIFDSNLAKSRFFIIYYTAISVSCSMQISRTIWNKCCGQKIFRDIWVQDEFQTDIPYCNSPRMQLGWTKITNSYSAWLIFGPLVIYDKSVKASQRKLDCLLSRLLRLTTDHKNFALLSLCAANPPATQGLYSLSGKTSYRQISRSLEVARLGVTIIVSLWNLTGIAAALLPRCLSNFRAIGKV